MIYVDKNENIHTYKGDAGNIRFTGLPTDREYIAYFSLVDSDSNKIIKELSQYTNQEEFIELAIPPSFTDDLPINSGEESRTYKYGFKVCFGDDETTLIPKVDIVNGNPQFQPAPDFIVYQKFVEGVA